MKPGVNARSTRREVDELRERVVSLEGEIQELRQLSKRIAEITDAVAEVLLPADQRDDVRLAQLLEAYDRTL
jgi:hypothetical protein